MNFKRSRHLMLAIVTFAVTGSIALAQDPGVVLESEVKPIFGFITDGDGNAISADSDPQLYLYTATGTKPVLAPDGHQLTLAEFTQPEALASVRCTSEGTRITLNMVGLVPNGTYTAWNFVFEEPGFDGTMAHRVGAGALGLNDGSNNYFTASASGRGSISVMVPAGPLSATLPADGEPYTVGACLLDEYEFHVNLNYHIDGQTYTKVPGPAGTFALQFGLIFANE